MIKLIVKIREDKKKKCENLSITGVEVYVREISKNVSDSERYCSELLKKRMHIGEGEREEIINVSSKIKDEIENLLKSLENL